MVDVTIIGGASSPLNAAASILRDLMSIRWNFYIYNKIIKIKFYHDKK